MLYQCLISLCCEFFAAIDVNQDSESQRSRSENQDSYRDPDDKDVNELNREIQAYIEMIEEDLNKHVKPEYIEEVGLSSTHKMSAR